MVLRPLEGRLTLDDAVVRAADRAARIWEASEAGPIVLGSERHKRAFCRMLIDTHNPYRPSIVDWPILEPEARDRLVSLPIWDIAMQTEGNASLRVLSYAETIEDPLLREAVEIDGFEETRHKQVLSNLVHILFFVNWVAWHRRNLPLWRRVLFADGACRRLSRTDVKPGLEAILRPWGIAGPH